jgi:hypothetical protein
LNSDQTDKKQIGSLTLRPD